MLRAKERREKKSDNFQHITHWCNYYKSFKTTEKKFHRKKPTL